VREQQGEGDASPIRASVLRTCFTVAVRSVDLPPLEPVPLRGRSGDIPGYSPHSVASPADEVRVALMPVRDREQIEKLALSCGMA